jgi:DNA-binding HxlR family transcriptional regulator
MKGYGQLCPVAKAAEVFCERWTALILRDLGAGATRFTELKRGLPLMSRSMLSRRLQELEHEGIIERRPNETGRGCTYQLTQAGREFLPIVEALGEWGRHWSRRDLAANEVDVSQLLWSMERSVRPDAFGDRRTVMQLEFTDQPGNRRRWWFVNETGEAQLCVKDPGFDVDLYLSVRLRDMIQIWRGNLSLAHAMDSGRLTMQGPSQLKRAVPAWLDAARPHGAHGSRDTDRLVPPNLGSKEL